jgi:hypothetical protein
MNNFELENFLKQTDCRGNKIGVLACDQLPLNKPMTRGSVIISNLSPITHSQGTHWVLFYSPPKHHPDYKGNAENALIFFDSLGVTDRELYPQFEKFFRNYSVIISNNDSPVQEIRRFSETCGMYCLYTAMHLCAGKSLQQIMNSFHSRDLNFNECNVLQFLASKFKTTHFNRYTGCKKTTGSRK